MINLGTQSGKSTLCAELLLRQNYCMDVPAEEIIYCYAEHKPDLFHLLSKNLPCIKFHQGLPTKFENVNNILKTYVLDDLITEICSSQDIIKTFCVTSHHQKINFIFMTQLFF